MLSLKGLISHRLILVHRQTDRGEGGWVRVRVRVRVRGGGGTGFGEGTKRRAKCFALRMDASVASVALV